MLRKLSSLLIILALVARALIPAGFMLSPATADDQSIIVVCTGHGPLAMAVDEDGKPAAPKQEKSSDAALCAFAASVVVAVATDLPDAAMPVVEVAIAKVAPATASAVIARRSIVPPARGPPSVS